MTLDIHMPEMGGIEYMETHFGSIHPPVVMISSASREDSATALRALSLGASDFVEKPSLTNLIQRGDEICSKLRVAASDKTTAGKQMSSMDKEFSREISLPSPDRKLLAIYGSLGQQKEIKNLLKEVKNIGVTTLLMFEGQDNLVEAFTEDLKSGGYEAQLFQDSNPLNDGKLHLASFGDVAATLDDVSKKLKICLTVFGECSKTAEQKF